MADSACWGLGSSTTPLPPRPSKGKEEVRSPPKGELEKEMANRHAHKESAPLNCGLRSSSQAVLQIQVPGFGVLGPQNLQNLRGPEASPNRHKAT